MAEEEPCLQLVKPAEGEKRSLAGVICNLKAAIEKLQVAHSLEQEKERRKTSDLLVVQMELLQNAFSSLADAVLEELDELGAEKIRLQREQQQWVAAVKALQDQVQSKLAQLGRIEDRVDAKLSSTAGLAAEVQELLTQGRSQGQGLAELRGEVELLAGQVARLDKAAAAAANEAAVAALTPVQRKQVKELAGDALRDQLPSAVASSIQRHVPPLIDARVEVRVAELRQDFTATASDLAADLGQLSREAGALRADVAAVAARANRTDAELAELDPRVARLEAAEAEPRASVALVAALEDKLDALAGQQARYSRSVEGVVKALVDDTASLSRAVRGVEGLYSGQQVQLQDTKEALLRSAQVFSQLLKVPSPVSSCQWGRPLGAAAAAAAAAAYSSPTSSPYTSPLTAAAAAAAGAAAAAAGGVGAGSASPAGKLHHAAAATTASPTRPGSGLLSSKLYGSGLGF